MAVMAILMLVEACAESLHGSQELASVNVDVLEHILMNPLRLYAVGGTRFLLQLNGR